MRALFVAFFGLCVACGADAATGRGRASMASQMLNESRAVASKNQISAMAMSQSGGVKQNEAEKTEESSMAVTPEVMQPAKKDMREKEKRACLSNNVGVGNTFVWASRYSNINDYSTMVEDTEEPENNTCFVRVELKSNDARINVADVPGKYFEMGHDITCGMWADENVIRQRILDAKKSARTWATVGGAVGGAGVGVGAMELFGNRLIGGKVMGQKDLEGVELLRSQLLVLKDQNQTEYNRFMTQLRTLKQYCDESKYPGVRDDLNAKDACEMYEPLFDMEI